MKHIKINIAITAFAAILFSSCSKDPFWGVKGRGDNETRTIDIKGFSKIDLSIDASVAYTQDSIYKVEITAQSNVQDVIKTELEGDKLQIGAKKNILKHNPIQIIVHSPSIFGFSTSGSGHIVANTMIATSSLKMDVSGSGGISLATINVQDLDAYISGSGNINISGGTIVNESFDVSGSGKVDAINIMANKSSVDISGSGDVSVWALENLHVDISGSGHLTYKGSPSIDLQISGSGKITHI